MGDTTWIKMLPGNVLKGEDAINKDKQIKISKPCRMLLYTSSCDKTRKYVYFMRQGIMVYRWTVEPNNTYEVLKFPSLSREFTSLAVKGSVWEFERDWVFQGYDATAKIYTIPAGTRITIANDKMMMGCGYNYHVEEKHLQIEQNPAFNMFGGRVVPAREVAAYLKLVKPGKVKTYWRLEKEDGTQHVKKNFASLSAVKASVRVRFGLVKVNYDNEDSAYVPEWLDNSDGWMDKPDHQKGVWAVQYDHATKKEIAREDLKSMVIMAVLST